MRIVSLIPSGTDIVAALGLGDSLVGVSHACDNPIARGLPVLTRSIIPDGLTPAEIDARVSAALAGQGGGSLYRADRTKLRELAPDVVLTQAICDVCAVNAASARRDLPVGTRLIDLNAMDFNGLWADLREVAGATGQDVEPQIDAMRARLRAVREAVAGRPRPRVQTLEWTDPPFIGGHWVPQIVEYAGGEHALGLTGEYSRRATWDEIAAADPDMILLVPCGYGLAETAAQGRALLRQPTFADLRAVRHGNVWATDATHLFSRCTPASVRAVEVVAGILHPEVCAVPAAHEAAHLE